MNFGLRLHLTLLPQTSGRRHRRRLASPLHGTLTPGRISVGRPPSGRTGVSLSLTESSQYSLPSAVFRSGGNRSAPFLWPFDRSLQRENPPLLFFCLYRWSWRTLRCRLPLSPRGPVRNVSKSSDIRFSRFTDTSYRYLIDGANCTRMLFNTSKSWPASV